MSLSENEFTDSGNSLASATGKDDSMSTTKSNIRNRLGKDEEQTIRTLTRYYPLNEETNSFEIALRYEKASDLFEENADNLDKASRVSESITERM